MYNSISEIATALTTFHLLYLCISTVSYIHTYIHTYIHNYHLIDCPASSDSKYQPTVGKYEGVR